MSVGSADVSEMENLLIGVERGSQAAGKPLYPHGPGFGIDLESPQHMASERQLYRRCYSASSPKQAYDILVHLLRPRTESGLKTWLCWLTS